MCFYMANSLRAGLEPAFAPYNGAFLSIRRPRVPEVNYSPAWMLPADSIKPYRNTLPIIPCGLFLSETTRSATPRLNVFLYGGRTENRTQIDWLKASYSNR